MSNKLNIALSIAIVIIVLVMGWLLWNRPAPRIIATTYYNNVIIWDTGCGCYVDAKTGRHVTRGLPAIVNGNIYAQSAASVALPAAAMHVSVPVTAASVPVPLINNGDLYMSGAAPWGIVGGLVVDCYDRKTHKDICQASSSTTKPPISVPEPSGAAMFGIGALAILFANRKRRNERIH